MKTAADIKADLAARAEAVAQHLLPRGKRVGSEWCAGDVNGSEGQSLKVCLVGSKAGVWADFAAGSGGDLLDLWGAAKGCTFVEALKQAKDYLGVRDDGEDRSFRRSVARTYVRPPQDGIQPLESAGPVFDYLAKERGISAATLHRYKIRQAVGHAGPECVFPITSPEDGKLDMVKFLAVKRGPDGKKIIRASKDSKPRLFGWAAIPPSARSIVITEGEIDALTVADWGHPALSVPSGVENLDWIEHDFEALARFERIYVHTDADEPGHKCAEKIASRLGRARCFRIVLTGFKDANEAHVSGRFVGPDYDDAMALARTLDPAELRNAGDYGDVLWEELHPSSPDTLGTETPWDMPWRIRPGEVTVWTGWNGHGKSHLLNNVMLHDMAAGQRCLIASFEMPVAQTLTQITSMMAGRRPGDRAKVNECLQWLAPRLWLYDVCGVKPWREFLPAFEYACRRYGITRIVIDSLVRVGVGEEDYEEQIAFVSAVVAFAAVNKCHVHIVAHSRKAKDEREPPGKMDIRGAGGITDLVHNGWTVHRNKAKEGAMSMAKDQGQCPPASLALK